MLSENDDVFSTWMNEMNECCQFVLILFIWSLSHVYTYIEIILHEFGFIIVKDDL